MQFIYEARKSIELIKVSEKESKSAIDWFKMNDMIVNPDRSQAMIRSHRVQRGIKPPLLLTKPLNISPPWKAGFQPSSLPD